MRLVAEHGIADVIIMRRLDIVEKYRVFYLGRVADDGVFANDGAASYECAVAHLGAVIDDAGAADVCRRKNRRILCDPYIFAALLKLILGQGIAKLDDKVLYIGQHLPRVGLALEKRRRYGLCQVQKFFDLKHYFTFTSLPHLAIASMI